MKLQPLNDKIVVKREEAEEKTAKGLYLPSAAQEKPRKGKVIALGQGRYLENGKRSNFQVKEGDKERLQAYEGVVIAKRNRGLNSSFIVRKISAGEGVERTFQTYSPLVASIEVKRRGDVRRAKLYYLRGRTGKSARIKEKLPAKKES